MLERGYLGHSAGVATELPRHEALVRELTLCLRKGFREAAEAGLPTIAEHPSIAASVRETGDPFALAASVQSIVKEIVTSMDDERLSRAGLTLFRLRTGTGGMNRGQLQQQVADELSLAKEYVRDDFEKKLVREVAYRFTSKDTQIAELGRNAESQTTPAPHPSDRKVSVELPFLEVGPGWSPEGRWYQRIWANGDRGYDTLDRVQLERGAGNLFHGSIERVESTRPATDVGTAWGCFGMFREERFIYLVFWSLTENRPESNGVIAMARDDNASIYQGLYIRYHSSADLRSNVYGISWSREP